MTRMDTLLTRARVRLDGPFADFLRTGKRPPLKSAEDERAFFMEMGRYGLVDEYFFGKVILGYGWLEDYHRLWLLEKNRHAGRNKLRLKSRGTGKSTVHTVIDALWEACRAPWRRQLIANAVEAKAVAFLTAIRDHVRLNRRFQLCYPDMTLKEGGDNKLSITFVKANMRGVRPEASIQVTGVRGSLVASHWDIIRCDDVVCDADMMSDLAREGTIAWFKRTQSLLQEDGWYDVTGTPWHKNDLYDWIERRNESWSARQQFIVSKQGATGPDGTLNFPRVYGQEKLDDLKVTIGSALFASQIMCNCLPEETQLFRLDRAKWFNPRLHNLSWYSGFGCWVDPATGKEKKGRADLDFTGIAVGGLTYDGEMHLLRAFKLQVPTSTLCTVLCSLQMEYKFNARFPIFFEANAFQGVVAEYLDQMARDRGVALTVQQVVNTRNKRNRIAVTEPLWTGGFIRLREDMSRFVDPITETKSYLAFINEVCDWPVAAHDDCPDTLAGLARGMMQKAGMENEADEYTTATYEDEAYADSYRY